MQRIHGFLLGLLCLGTFFSSSAQAQTNNYTQSNRLTADATLSTAGSCGHSGGGAGTGTQRGMTTAMITGTSGSLSHSASVSLTVQ